MAPTATWSIRSDQQRLCYQVCVRDVPYPHSFWKDDHGQYTLVCHSEYSPFQAVPQASAIIPGIANAEPVAIPADHLNMVKFASREDPGYVKMSGYLQLLAEEAPSAIDARWTEQDKIREGKK